MGQAAGCLDPDAGRPSSARQHKGADNPVVALVAAASVQRTSEGALAARLPAAASPAESLELPEPLDAQSWRVGFGGHGERPALAVFSHLTRTLGPLGNVFVQFRTDNLGRHEYVCLGDAESSTRPGASDGVPLRVVLEDEVKARRMEFGDAVVVLTALRPQQEAAMGATAVDTVTERELCPPRSLYRNYSVCGDLTLGHTQRVMLCDEHTLHTGVQKNGIKIFNHLSLIVNCHETAKADHPGKYSVGTARPKVIFQPIHELMRAKPEVVAGVMDGIQKEIWRSLQEGSVAVHCLAGLHRAPTVVVCHYLYRHYALGHSEVCADVETIYSRLRKVRPNVEPLGYYLLIDAYKDYLVARHGGA